MMRESEKVVIMGLSFIKDTLPVQVFQVFLEAMYELKRWCTKYSFCHIILIRIAT
jgi:hypothetical protein